ncbi:hypothetical protein GPDM_06990 [Planococcus donghaensis MPA1U2]|uniref:DUF3006 domain-containing protein n=2 Tax=Planococcus donghaensis TaxID=414778 RepID=E7RFW8_9BACL|nr:hypothetical protein GPDM_06990 [Planococcus donghaensis MPA1U2]
MKGILDRIEDDRYAVILVEEEEGLELILPVNRLPAGSQVNSWFTIDSENGQLAVTLDHKTSFIKDRQAEELIARLRKKKTRSRFKRE